MLDRYHTASICPDEVALSAAFLKCGELMKARRLTQGGAGHEVKIVVGLTPARGKNRAAVRLSA